MDKPENCIPRGEAKELSENWWKTRGRAIEDVEHLKDICAVNFSIAELEDYLAYVKANSTNVKDPGISIWMAAYTGDPDETGEHKKGYSTIFLSPTKKKAAGSFTENENDFEENDELDPYNHGSGVWPPGVYGS